MSAAALGLGGSAASLHSAAAALTAAAATQRAGAVAGAAASAAGAAGAGAAGGGILARLAKYGLRGAGVAAAAAVAYDVASTVANDPASRGAKPDYTAPRFKDGTRSTMPWNATREDLLKVIEGDGYTARQRRDARRELVEPSMPDELRDMFRRENGRGLRAQPTLADAQSDAAATAETLRAAIGGAGVEHAGAIAGATFEGAGTLSDAIFGALSSGAGTVADAIMSALSMGVNVNNAPATNTGANPALAR